MTPTIRKFNFETLDDYRAIEQIERDVYPDDYETANEYRHMDKAHGEHFKARWLAFDGALPIGWAETKKAHWFEEPDQYNVNATVITAYQGNGIGKALYAAVQNCLDQLSPKALINWTREDMQRSIRFLEERGFAQIMRDAQSELDVTTFDASRFSGIREKMASQGVKLYSITELQQIEPEWKHKIWEMRWPIRQDIPSTETLKQTPFEQWETMMLESPTFDAAGFVIAIAPDGEYIGYSHIHTSDADPTKLYTGVTGTKRAWRRKGVATALKLRIIDYAKATGVTRIVTENEENNPMYALNVALGFKPIPGWLTMKKTIAAATNEIAT